LTSKIRNYPNLIFRVLGEDGSLKKPEAKNIVTLSLYMLHVFFITNQSVGEQIVLTNNKEACNVLRESTFIDIFTLLYKMCVHSMQTS